MKCLSTSVEAKVILRVSLKASECIEVFFRQNLPVTQTCALIERMTKHCLTQIKHLLVCFLYYVNTF